MPKLKKRVKKKLRSVGARFGHLPNFLIIGAMKSGTSSLFRWLASHPAVAVSKPKEVHYFDENYERGVHWYKRHFPMPWTPEARSARAWGEASPYYLFHEETPRRVAELLPDVRLIALLRNPVGRAFSHYQHVTRNGHEDRPFAEAVEAELRHLQDGGATPLHPTHDPAFSRRKFHYVKRGLYAEQIERWLQHFRRDQLLVLRSENLFRESEKTYAEVLSFLDLPYHGAPFDRRNAGGYRDAIDRQTWQRLRTFFAPHNRRLEELLDCPMGWDR